jgi:sorbose reductase
LALEGARALLEHGLSGVALFDLNPSAASESISTLQKDFPNAAVISKQVDVTNAVTVNLAVIEVAKELGSVDIVCCFAGIVGCSHALDVDPAEFRRILDINTTGAFLCAQAGAK